MRTENERLEQENVHLKKELARLNGTNLQERRCLKPWSQLGRERKRRLLKDILGTVQNVADHYETSVICVSANIMYRGAFAVKRTLSFPNMFLREVVKKRHILRSG